MTSTPESMDKMEKVAHALYVADYQLNEADSSSPLPWEMLDADDKFAWLFMANAATREIMKLEEYQKDSIIENYRGKSPYPIQKGDTWESVTLSHFEYGWNEAFFAFDQPLLNPDLNS